MEFVNQENMVRPEFISLLLLQGSRSMASSG